MAGDGDASKLTGLGKYFNGTTMAGRANVSLLTGYICYCKLQVMVNILF